jgi:hypothetical protein
VAVRIAASHSCRKFLVWSTFSSSSELRSAALSAFTLRSSVSIWTWLSWHHYTQTGTCVSPLDRPTADQSFSRILNSCLSLSTHRAEHSCSCRRSSPTPHESAGKYSEIAQHDLRKEVSYIDGSLPQQCFLYCPLFDVFLLLGFSYFLLLATMRWFSCVSWSLALLLLRTGHVLARLPQKQTNGNSLLGDLSQSSLAEFLTETSLPDGYPWGKATAFNTNYYTSSPNTGFVPSYL